MASSYSKGKSPLAQQVAEKLAKEVVPEELLSQLASSEYDPELYGKFLHYIQRAVPKSSSDYQRIHVEARIESWTAIFLELTYRP